MRSGDETGIGTAERVESLRTACREHQQLRAVRVVFAARRTYGTWCLFQDRVRVRAAEAERVDSGPSRGVVFRERDGRDRNAERQCVEGNPGVWRLEVQVRWNRLVIKAEARPDHP